MQQYLSVVEIETQGRSEGGGGIGGWLTPTFLELTYSENRVGHSGNYAIMEQFI